MLPTILCGIDRSREALAAARAARLLACRLGMRLELMHVVDHGEPASAEDLARLEAAALGEVGIPVLLRIGRGGVAERLALAGADCEMIVVGTRRRGVAQRNLLGSVSGELMRLAAVPVLVIPDALARPAGTGSSVVCAVDGERDAATALAAARIARGLRIPLTLAHVASGHARARTWLEDLAATLDPEDLELAPPEVLSGRVDLEIGRLVDEQEAALVTVGERGALPGPVADAAMHRIIEQSQVPVLVCPRLEDDA